MSRSNDKVSKLVKQNQKNIERKKPAITSKDLEMSEQLPRSLMGRRKQKITNVMKTEADLRDGANWRPWPTTANGAEHPLLKVPTDAPGRSYAGL